jgi:Ca2+-binding RTX toxin-like protein
MLGAMLDKSPAFSRLPENYPSAGDVFLSTTVASDAYTKVGTHEYETVFHEVGHALGLNHPGNYNGQATEPNAKGPFVPIGVDNVMNTVMSYNFKKGDSEVTTLMPYDIRALQYMYGKNTSFNNTDTTYTLNFNTATLNDASNADMNSLNLNLAGKRTIWDAGGKDTLNARGLPTDNYYFDLSPGGLLTAQSARNANASTYEGQDGQKQAGVTYLIDRFGIRLAFDMQIENLLGTDGNDEVLGNTSDNLLVGGNGHDTMAGNDGNDTLSGDDGNDILSGNKGVDVLSGGNGNDFIVGGRDNDSVSGNAGDDLIVSGNIGSDLVDGGDGNDLLVGGQDNDTLLGGAGNDTLSGDLGQDVLTGGTGADIFTLRSIASTTDLTQADVITDFEVTTDSIGLSTGVTQVVEDTTLNGVTGSLIRNASDRSILGFVNNVFSSQLATRFVTSSL